MSSPKERLSIIHQKICFIESIIAKNGGIVNALSDEEIARPAILMHLISIAEQFDKLSKNGEFEILSRFDKRDIKGSYDVRNYIAHDYEGINLAIIEALLRDKLPLIKVTIEDILKSTTESGAR